MSLQSGYIGVIGSSMYSDESVQKHPLGTKVTDGAGRELRYIKAGEALAAGKLVQSSTEHANHESLTPAAAAIGATSVTATLGNTAVTANEYAGGWLVVTNTPGLGLMYEIASHPAANGSASLTVTLKDPIKVALTTDSRFDLVHNPYSDCLTWVDGTGTYTGAPVGVTAYAITSGQYGWVVVQGAASCLANGTLTIGQGVVASNAIDGAVEVAVNDSTETQAPVGYALTTGADTEYPAIFVNIG